MISDDGPPIAPPVLLPSPFQSAQAVAGDEVALDFALTRLAELFRADRLEEAEGVVETAKRVEGLNGIREASRSYGDPTQDIYVYADERFGRYVHFVIDGSRLRLFVPAICNESLSSHRPTLGQFLPYAPSVEGAMSYFDVACDHDIHLRLFVDDSGDAPVISEILMYRSQ